MALAKALDALDDVGKRFGVVVVEFFGDDVEEAFEGENVEIVGVFAEV